METKIEVKLFKRLGTLTNNNHFKTFTFNAITEALEIAEYFYNEHFYQVQVMDKHGDIYAEFEN
jgi:hypothetical protein